MLRLDVAKNAVSDFRTPKVPADFTPYVTEQVFYPSKDGTRVPMFIMRRKDAPRDGNQPVMLYGYGGFNVTLSPSFSPAIQAWLEMGGIYVVANLRGGGEYGEEWHQAGTQARKSRTCSTISSPRLNTWSARNTRTPKRLAIIGRSNGGLLVGAALTQRPESVWRRAARCRRAWTCCDITPPARTRASGRATTVSRRRRRVPGAARVFTRA